MKEQKETRFVKRFNGLDVYGEIYRLFVGVRGFGKIGKIVYSELAKEYIFCPSWSVVGYVSNTFKDVYKKIEELNELVPNYEKKK